MKPFPKSTDYSGKAFGATAATLGFLQKAYLYDIGRAGVTFSNRKLKPTWEESSQTNQAFELKSA